MLLGLVLVMVLAFGWCGVLGPFHLFLSPPVLFTPQTARALVSCQPPPLSPFFFLLPFCLICDFCCLVLGLATVFTPAPHSLVLADTAAATVLTPAPHSLVLAEAAAAAVFTPAPLSLVLAEAAAAADFTLVSPSVVLA